MTLETFIRYFFWITPGLLQAAIMVIMYRRQLHRELPTFFAYTSLQVLRFIVLFPLAHGTNYAAYFYAYWGFGALSLIFGFAVVREIFFYSFRPYESLSELGTILFRWATAVLILLTVLTAANVSDAGGISAFVGLLISFERSVRLTQVGLLVFLLLFCKPLGITSAHRVFGIAMGLGSYAAIEVSISGLAMKLGIGSAPWLSPAKAAAYTFATVLWTIYVSRPEPQRVTSGAMEPMFSKWNAALMPHFQPAGGNKAFISNIDDTVQRILDRTNGK